jgi:hypothetical protein
VHRSWIHNVRHLDAPSIRGDSVISTSVVPTKPRSTLPVSSSSYTAQEDFFGSLRLSFAIMSEKSTGSDLETRADPQPHHNNSQSISWFRLVYDQALVTPDVQNWSYAGSGTEEDPYVVEWIPNDPRNPMRWANWKKWCLVALVSIATLAVAFVSSAYTGGLSEVIVQFHTSELIVTLGVSLFVLGFAIGPLMWAPMSEIFGRQVLFIGTYAALTAFNAGAAGAKDITTLLLMRFFAGSFGSSPLTVSKQTSSAISGIFSNHYRTPAESSQICSMPINVV